MRSGAKGLEVEEAEAELRKLKQRDVSRRELLQRARAAQEVGREDRLRQCVEEAEKQNLLQDGVGNWMAPRSLSHRSASGLFVMVFSLSGSFHNSYLVFMLK